MRMLDLFCGRFGWGRAFAAKGWEVVGVDLVEPPEIPQGCRFVQADVFHLATLGWLPEFRRWPTYEPVIEREFFVLDGPNLGRFDFICTSSPCEQFSVHGMKHFHPNPPYPELGIQLFNHTRSLCEASGLPYVMENVRYAQDFVGRAQNHAGPFYLWGSAVPPLMPQGIKKGFQTGGTIIQKLKRIDRQALTEYRRQNDGSWSSSKSAKRKEWTAKAATIPPELAACVADYAERLLEQEREAQEEVNV